MVDLSVALSADLLVDLLVVDLADESAELLVAY